MREELFFKVKIILDSIAKGGDARLTTFELEYPLIAHSHLLTHRVFSRNSRSERAVSTKEVIERIEKNPYFPLKVGKQQKGMKGYVDLDEKEYEAFLEDERELFKHCLEVAKRHEKRGVHQEFANRVLSKFATIKTVVTSLDFENFFRLRTAEDAQFEIQTLARKMEREYRKSSPVLREKHVPYSASENMLEAVEAIARVSYDRIESTNKDVSKNARFVRRLYEAEHLSPFESVAISEKGKWVRLREKPSLIESLLGEIS